VSFYPEEIVVNESGLASEIDNSILDIPPTMSHVLGLPDLPDAIGKVRHETKAEYGVMILLDGLQFHKLITLINTGQLPFFEHTNEIERALTVYPSVTTSATAAVLTGTTPQINGIFGMQRHCLAVIVTGMDIQMITYSRIALILFSPICRIFCIFTFTKLMIWVTHMDLNPLNMNPH